MVLSASLRKKIKRKMKQKEMNISQLAKEAGVSRSGISNILNEKASEKKDINTETLEKIAQALGCTVELLQH